MFRHVVLFRFIPDITDAQRDAVLAGLAALPGKIPEIRGYRYGPDAGITEGNWDFAVVADFDDRAGFEVYAPHPDHRAFIADCMVPVMAERAAVQIDLSAVAGATAPGG